MFCVWGNLEKWNSGMTQQGTRGITGHLSRGVMCETRMNAGRYGGDRNSRIRPGVRRKTRQRISTTEHLEEYARLKQLTHSGFASLGERRLLTRMLLEQNPALERLRRNRTK